MSTVKIWTDAEVEAAPRLKAVFADIRATRKSDFVNNFWRGLCNQPSLLERTWANLKEVMVKEGSLDPLTKELIYVAVSTVSCRLENQSMGVPLSKCRTPITARPFVRSLYRFASS